MDVAVRDALQARVLADQRVEFLALRRECAVQRNLRLDPAVVALPAAQLAALALGQQDAAARLDKLP